MPIWGVVVDNSAVESGNVVLTLPLFAYRVLRVLASEFGLMPYLYSEGLTDSTDSAISEFLGALPMDVYTKEETLALIRALRVYDTRFTMADAETVVFTKPSWFPGDRYFVKLATNSLGSFEGFHDYYSLVTTRSNLAYSIVLGASSGQLSIYNGSGGPVNVGLHINGGD